MATHIHPHTASHSPARPVSSYSMGSTIRDVTPSPDSLSEALSKGYAAHSTPRGPAQTQSMEDLGRTYADEMTLLSCGEKSEYGDHDKISHTRSESVPSKRPATSRRITPSRIPVPTNLSSSRSRKVGYLQRRKAGRIPSSKLGAPRHHRPVLPAGPISTTQTSENQVILAESGSQAVAAGLAMPKEPLRAPPVVPLQDEERERLGAFTLFPTEDPFLPEAPASIPAPALAIDPTRPARRPEGDFHSSYHTLPHHSPTSPRKPLSSPWKNKYQSPQPSRPNIKKPDLLRHPSSTSQASHATFSTPGRDEMERKRGHMQAGDEGPFGGARGVQELIERRRQVSESKIRSERKKERGDGKSGNGKGLCRCVIM